MRIDIPESRTLAFETRFPVRWGDMDAFGHVNNVQYFRYLENVRVDWLRAVNFLQTEAGEGVVVANVFCNFYSQLTYPCDLVARLYLTQLGRSSFDHVVTFERSDVPGATVAAGGATIVWVSTAQGRPLPLPEGLRQLFKALQDGSVAALGDRA